MIVPTIPALQAGHVATASDMNALSSAATFLMSKPYTRVQATATQSGLSTGGTAITYAGATYDNDGMWSASFTSRLTVVTGGHYKVRYGVPINNQNATGYAQITTGANNPGGSGVTFQVWPGACGVSASGYNTVSAAGILPYFLYPGDYVQVFVVPQSTAATVTTDVAAFMSLDYVSTM